MKFNSGFKGLKISSRCKSGLRVRNRLWAALYNISWLLRNRRLPWRFFFSGPDCIEVGFVWRVNCLITCQEQRRNI